MTITDNVRVNMQIFPVTLVSFDITTAEIEQLGELNYSQAFIDNQSSRCN